jgi:hypothetical protein
MFVTNEGIRAKQEAIRILVTLRAFASTPGLPFLVFVLLFLENTNVQDISDLHAKQYLFVIAI